MAKDDYHVIVYWLLSYLYDCLKKGKTPDEDTLCLLDYPQDLNDEYKKYIFQHLYSAGFIEGLTMKPLPVLSGKKEMYIRNLDRTRITPAGIEYLQNNGVMQKAKDFVKTAAGPLATLFSTLI